MQIVRIQLIMSLNVSKLNVDQWLLEKKTSFAPPICNQLMYADQLKVQFVGGPNRRKDYCLEEGEKFFYQIEGSMILRVVEYGRCREIPIHAGQVFLLPARTYHSPQREANTIGLVFRRHRAPYELDCMTYFVESSSDCEAVVPIWERWFHCDDLVKDVPSVIEEYFQSEAHATGQPAHDSFPDKPAFKAGRTVPMDNPISLRDWFQKHKTMLQIQGPQYMWPNTDHTHVLAYYGHFGYLDGLPNAQAFVYNINGNTTVSVNEELIELGPGDCTLLPEGVGAELHCVDSQAYGFTVQMPTPMGHLP